MGHAIFTRRALRIVRRREEKRRAKERGRGKKEVEEDACSWFSRPRGAFGIDNEREKRRERERYNEGGKRGDSTEWFISILFLLCSVTRRWRFIDFSLRRSRGVGRCNKLFVAAFCVVRRATSGLNDGNVGEISLSSAPPTEVVRPETIVKSNLSRPFLPAAGKIYFAGYTSVKTRDICAKGCKWLNSIDRK